ncbi:MAG: metallophosphoesterase [Myxococcales bacterium]|nr:MAG: metallophosphoesterase [Myxococcales bacterium]
MFRVAHLSDLHATPVRAGLPALLGKRFFGWLSWRLRRRHAHQPGVLAALVDDLHREAPDQIVVTGDLTNVAGEEEFPAARAWLERIGPPERVSIVPGNHDAYVPVARARGVGLWSDYIASDAGDVNSGPPGEYPTLRVRGPLAVVGVSSAVPTPIFQAGGRVGAAQLARLGPMLDRLGRAGLFRLVLVHHPPEAGVVSSRRELRDGAALRDVLARVGAELVLHGHTHRTRLGSLPGPTGAIPVVGARSASDVGQRPEKRAQYHLYEVSPAEGGRFRIRMRVRGYDPATGGFVAEDERSL